MRNEDMRRQRTSETHSWNVLSIGEMHGSYARERSVCILTIQDTQKGRNKMLDRRQHFSLLN
jgi:hypothetical protein